jgi:hypothetical protein
MKYSTFCRGMNEEVARKSKKKIIKYIYMLTKNIKSVLCGVAVRLSYI